MYQDDTYDDAPAGPAHYGIPPGALPDWRPVEAQRMGLSRHTEEGALVDFAARLSPAKPGHRLTAWIMLLAFAAPALYTIYLLL